MRANRRDWTLTTLREKLIKIGAKVVRHFPKDRLPDGGSGGSARVVSGPFWKGFELARSGDRMKEKVKGLA